MAYSQMLAAIYFGTMRTLLTIGTILIFVTSCRQEFEKSKWQTQGDLETYPYRESMLWDILENKKLVGQKLIQIRDLLGPPDSIVDGEMDYIIIIIIDYGSDIDPVYLKHLVVTFDKDTIVTGTKIREWKK
jgi:hypothetical protein